MEGLKQVNPRLVGGTDQRSIQWTMTGALMKVHELMQRDVVAMGPDATLSDVVERLADSHVTGLPVIDQRRTILGVISTSDVLEAQAEGRPGGWADTLVSDVMTRTVITIPADADVREAAQRMLYGQVHRLLVEEGGVLVGVISQTDLVRAFATRKLVG